MKLQEENEKLKDYKKSSPIKQNKKKLNKIKTYPTLIKEHPHTESHKKPLFFRTVLFSS